MSNETLITGGVFIIVVQFLVIGYLMWLLTRSGDEKRDMFTVEMLQAITGAILNGATAIVETTPSPDDNELLDKVKDFLGKYGGVDTDTGDVGAGGLKMTASGQLTPSNEALLTAGFVSKQQDSP